MPQGDTAVERTNEPKIVLLVRLLNAIDEGRFSFEDLKDRIAEGEHRPSTRSLRRYLAILADAGFPWYFDRPSNTYKFSDGYSLKRLDLNNSELFGLVALRSISATLGGAIGTYVDEVTEKLVSSSNRRVKEKVVAPSPVAFRLSEIRLDQDGEKIFEQLSAAERNTRTVTFLYQDKEGNRSKRTADPYGFIVNSGRVYCVAYDHDRRDKRVFAVDSISELATLAQSFIKPASFNVEAFAAGSISGVLNTGTTTTVQVTFAQRVAKAAAAARIVSDQQTQHNPDGSITITYNVSDLDELIRWILGWGPQAEITSPPEARRRIQTLATQISAKYSNLALAQ